MCATAIEGPGAVVFVRAGHTPERHPGAVFLEELRCLVVEHTGEGHRVDAHVAVRPVRGEVTGNAEQAGLGRAVRDWLEELIALLPAVLVQPLVGRDDTINRADVHDRATSRVRERGADHLTTEERARQVYRENTLPARFGISLEWRIGGGSRIRCGIESRVVDERVRLPPMSFNDSERLLQ